MLVLPVKEANDLSLDQSLAPGVGRRYTKVLLEVSRQFCPEHNCWPVAQFNSQACAYDNLSQRGL